MKTTNLKNSLRATENHQGFKNLDTFKFALIIDNTSEIYSDKIKMFQSCYQLTDKQTKEKIKDFLKSQTLFVKNQESDFYINFVNFNSLVQYYFEDFQEYKKDTLLNLFDKENNYIFANYKRYFNKLNWNSYFVYIISFEYPTTCPIIYKSNDLEYGYSSQPEQTIKEKLKEIFGEDLSKLKINYNDNWYYQTQKELKNFINF